jgi:hypothetical protein
MRHAPSSPALLSASLSSIRVVFKNGALKVNPVFRSSQHYSVRQKTPRLTESARLAPLRRSACDSREHTSRQSHACAVLCLRGRALLRARPAPLSLAPRCAAAARALRARPRRSRARPCASRRRRGRAAAAPAPRCRRRSRRAPCARGFTRMQRNNASDDADGVSCRRV